MVNCMNTNGHRHCLAEIRPGENSQVLVVSANGTKIFVVKPGDQEQVAFPELKK